MFKIAAIDIGSNAFRLTMGETDGAGKVKVNENIRIPVRLGEDVFTRGRLLKLTIQEMEAAFERFQRLIEDAGVYTFRAVATSAMRDASNGQVAIDRIQASSGIKLEIIDSVEEARLVHLAVSHAMNLKDKRTLMVDIGGGSVEVSISNDDMISFTNSYNLGAVRLLKMMEKKDKSDHTAAQRIAKMAEPALRQIGKVIDNEPITVFAGTGGSLEEIGRLTQRLFKTKSDRLIYLQELDHMVERLSGMTPADIGREFQLRPDRADVILAAAVVLQLIARQAHIQRIDIPNVSLREGILYDLAEELSSRPQPDRRAKVLESALHMGHKYQFDEPHAALTARLAREMFQQLQPLHRLEENDLLLLEVGALLHDIGHFINTIDHDKHGYYLLRVNHLMGLSHREQVIVANLVRYHRGRTFFMEEADFKALPSEDRRTILKLSAILSLADGMDIHHTGRVQDISLEKTEAGWRLHLPTEQGMEKWALEKRKALFEEVFGVTLQMG